MMNRLRTVAFLLAAALLLAIIAPAAERSAPYVLAVIPSSPPEVTHTLWTPFIEQCSRDSGLSFRLKVYEKMSDFERDISRGVPDFLFANPLQSVVAHAAQGYAPLVRGEQPVSAELFVLKDSPIRTADDLANRKVAFVGIKNL